MTDGVLDTASLVSPRAQRVAVVDLEPLLLARTHARPHTTCCTPVLPSRSSLCPRAAIAEQEKYLRDRIKVGGKVGSLGSAGIVCGCVAFGHR